ncbi:MAG TPA: FG-GAP repeat protein, partial [Methylotenera sp.]|nr:FG-GAP repeat protein [Methylotenera sp.]
EKLHVAGNIKADTVKPTVVKITPNAGTGKVLTSDASGNGSWQNSAASAASGSIGFGVWGDCATNGNISEYHPVADATGSTGDNFGVSVSMSGNYAIAGAYGDDGGLGVDQGSASIYQFNGSSWVLMQKLTDATGATLDFFGYSVYISGIYAIVGSPFDDGALGTDQGSASIYKFNGSSWVLMQKLTDASGAASDYFGISVAITDSYAIIGAYVDDGPLGADQGSVSIYKLNGANWVLSQKITDATGGTGDFFGFKVALSGNYALVGAFGEDGVEFGVDQGSASIYQYNGSNWVLMQKLIDATGNANDNFGGSVAIAGNYAIVGAYADDGLGGVDEGSASIYRYNGSTWVLMQKITVATAAASDNFGASVALSENYAVIGASRDSDAGGVQQGSATIYVRVGLGWQKLQYLTDPAGAASDRFGTSVGFDEASKRFIIGAFKYTGDSGKVVFGKIN